MFDRPAFFVVEHSYDLFVARDDDTTIVSKYQNLRFSRVDCDPTEDSPALDLDEQSCADGNNQRLI